MNLKISTIFLGISISAVSGYLRGDIHAQRPERELKRSGGKLDLGDVVDELKKKKFEDGYARTSMAASRAFDDFDIMCGTQYSRSYLDYVPAVVDVVRETGGGSKDKKEKTTGYRVFPGTPADAVPLPSINEKKFCKDFKNEKECKDDCFQLILFENCNKVCEDIDECFDDDEDDNEQEKCCEKIVDKELIGGRRLEKNERKLSGSKKGDRMRNIDCTSTERDILRAIPGWYYQADGDKDCKDLCKEECEDHCDGESDEDECEKKCEKDCEDDLCDCLDFCDFSCGAIDRCFDSCAAQEKCNYKP